MSSIPQSQSDADAFSLRIVTLDYYMSPPIPNLDFSYSTFQGRNVEEVPVIRIYGSTPAGQKACLHAHQALPYLYIPCPDNAIKNPEEGDKFIHMLSNALEKALKHKRSSATKRQHVHECRLVRAKKLYGYHPSDDLFVKIYLYYPHEVGRAATMLLDGAVLNMAFQPYESHIPYLLQFLVDYNLYGMSHIHLLKFKFRPPVPDGYIPRVACLQRRGVQAHRSAVWLTSTVPSGSIWSDSPTGNGLEDEPNHLIRRQSTCALEVDASVKDILNEKYKMYTSLSQTRSEVKMVQSLVPIWEEEYERSGTPDSVRPPDSSKPAPESVLGCFNHGLEFQKALSELYVGTDETFPSNVSATEGDGNLENCPSSRNPSSEPFKYLSDGDKIVIPPCSSLFQENKHAALFENMFDQLKSPDKSLSEVCRNAAQESLNTEALGLLSWFASTQAAEGFSVDDELVHEAFLSPLLSAKSYKEALEIARLDYESASQQECRDILDSLHGLHRTEGPREQASCSTDQDLTINVSSGNAIPQVDGSFDDDFNTPQKDKLSEANTTGGKDKYSGHQMGRCSSTRFGSKHKRSKLLWGPLPFAFKQKEQEISELVSCRDEEIKSDGESSFSSGSKGDRCCKAGLETCDEKEGNVGSLSSIRDLMRRKRCLRTEQLDTVMHNNEMMELCTEEPMHHKSDGEICNVIPQEGSNSKSCNMDQDVVVTCTEACTYHACTEELHIDHCSPPSQKSVSSFSDQLVQSEIPLDEHHHFRKESSEEACVEATTELKGFKVTDMSVPQVQSIKFSDADHTRNSGTAIFSTISGSHKTLMSDTSQCTMKTCNIKLVASSQKFKSLLVENSNVEVMDFHNCERPPVDEPFKEKVDTCTRNLTTIHVEQSLMHNLREHKSNHDNEITQERFLQTHFNRNGESDSVLDRDIQNGENDFNADWRNNSLNPDFETSIDLNKIKDTSAYVEMSWSRKPPSRDEVGKYPEDSVGTTGHAENVADINSGRKHLDVLPFFSWKFEDGNSSKRSTDEDPTFHYESALGIPTHFQNDGSVLYLLTHTFLPPTRESVHQWLLEKVEGNCLNVSEGDGRDEISTKSRVTHCMMPDISSQGSIGATKAENHDSQVNVVSNEQKSGLQFKEKAVNSGSHDFSQISGPDREEKSALTPLSQMGFRDSASIDGGQQLTLISMEVQAESRGDLLPNPKIDAINVLSLAVQEDSSQTVDVYVLMRCNNEELYERNVDGVSDCNFSIFNDEKHLLDHFVKMVSLFDPDVLMGWEIQGGSLGFLAERAAHLGINLLKKISRICACKAMCKTSDLAEPELNNMQNPVLVSDTVSEYSIIEDEWGRTHASGIHVSGRIVLNVWRLMRAELKLNMYSVEAVAEEVLKRKIPSIPNRVLNFWFLSGPSRARYRCIEFVTKRAKLNLEIMNQLDMINRTSELARVFGIDFFSVLSRGSQFRVESMLLRLAHTQNYLAISPGNQQVASQPAMECLPLVMEPESGFYADPVVVLDFQSLYPSMIIAYNLCYSTCLGTVFSSKASVLGVTSYFPDPLLLKDLKQQILLTPNGIMYVPLKVRKGVLPRLLEEILSTRIMVKQAMKKLMPSQQVLQRIFNARQLALKLIANVTYGYTAAGFSGRMPCAELADSIVQCGRRTLETAISFVNQHDKWKARVIYGDTDSMFVLLKGRSREEAFRIGNEIASAITSMNPDPVTLKMEKVYHPCFLLTKKRYVGYSYESPDQEKPIFDAKGIETVRRDTCPAVAKTLERSIRLIFEHQDISVVKTYLQREWRRICSGKVSLQDFVFAKEVRLGTYSARASSLPPAAIVAFKAMQIDPRAEPQYGERIPYVVIHGEPGARLVDMVVNPHILLDINSPYRLNELYYINKQIIPALQRVFGLVGADLKQWFSELPRLVRPTPAKRHSNVSHSESLNEFDNDIRSETSKLVQAKRNRIDTYYISKHCTLCGNLAQTSSYLCGRCSKKEPLVATVVIGKASRLEREIQHLAAICRHCGGGDWLVESGVKCTSLACSVFYERRKVQKELQATSSFATAAGLYPRCMAEWF